MLENYAQKNGFTGIRHFTDHGISGTTFEREGLQSMQNLLNPVEDLAQVLKTPIKLAKNSSLNRQGNSVDIASDRRIAVNDGYILTVKPQGVKVSDEDNPYD